MRRSTVNDILRAGTECFHSFGHRLPPFGYMAPDELRQHAAENPMIAARRLGWDITDYGQGKFDTLGLLLFTLRNGSLADLTAGGGMCYAEKLMISRRDQVSPMHRHIVKAEDIINRGGSELAIRMYTSDSDGEIDRHQNVIVTTDGVQRQLNAGDVLRLGTGESVTLMPGNWHEFWGVGGDVLIGEVSAVNDDLTDNIFEDPIGRFSQIEEDVDPLHLLVSDYETLLAPA